MEKGDRKERPEGEEEMTDKIIRTVKGGYIAPDNEIIDALWKENARLQGIVEKQRSALEYIRNEYNAAKAVAEDECTIAIGSGVKTAMAFAYRDMKIGMIRAKLFRIEEVLSLTATDKETKE